MVSRLTKNNNVNATRLILRPKNHIHFALKKTARRALRDERIFFCVCVFALLLFVLLSSAIFSLARALARVSVVLEFSSNTTRPHEELYQQQRDVHEDDVLLLHRLLLLPFVVVVFFSETVAASSWTTGRRRREKKELHREIFNFSIFTAIIVGGKSG